MDVKSFDHDTETGFAWIIVNGKEGEEMSIQCCLETSCNEPTISMGDCGHDWGICADGNAEAFALWGENRCMKALFNRAKECGLVVID